jgi:hypothetical protein
VALLALAACYALKEAGRNVEEAIGQHGWLWWLIGLYRALAAVTLRAIRRVDREEPASLIAPGALAGALAVSRRAHAAPLNDGRWPMNDERWPMADERWPMADGRWPMADDR